MAEFCKECERLLADYLSAVRETRVTLEAAARAAEAGIVDDVGFVVADAELERTLGGLRLAQQAYGLHRKERH